MSQSSAAVGSSDSTTCHNSQHLSITDLDEQSKILGIFFYSAWHFFGDVRTIFFRITDPRDPRKITYQVGDLAFSAILMFMCGLQARRQMAHLLRGGRGADQFREVFGAPTCPHGDTLNDAFARMDPAEFQALLCWMVYCLIRKKVLYNRRLMDRYFLIAIDGTWTLKRKKRHCRKCLTQTHNGKTTYYHMVVEAKLVTPDGFAIPLFTEFVENTGDDSKQDCELKAFYRIAEKIKAHFPRLPVTVSIDGLFAGGPVFRVCRELGWKFMVVLKDGSLPTVNQEFESLRALQPENRLTYR
ncbi:MAG: transposase family protein [Deltaproteobacteria bacterium]|nr:transposase family protein [Deltaproteobacteria bacterium]